MTFVATRTWLPNPPSTGFANSGAFVIDASGEVVVLVFQAERAGTIDRFDANVSVVTNSPDNGLRFSLQSVDAATGLQTGTILGATNNAFVTYAHTVTTGWKSTNFAEGAVVTRGQIIAAVIDIPSFTASDSVSIGGASGPESKLPYAISVISTKVTSALPSIVIHYTDGYAQGGSPISATNANNGTQTVLTFNNGTGTADEWGASFQLPYAFKMDRVNVYMSWTAGAVWDVVVYEGNTEISATSYDGDQFGASSLALTTMLFPEITGVAATTYRVMIRPTSTTDVAIYYSAYNDLTMLNANNATGHTYWLSSRLNAAGAFTEYNTGTFRRSNTTNVGISAVHDGAGGGGGTVARVIGS